MKTKLIAVLCVGLATQVFAEVDLTPPTSATAAEGLEAWGRIFEVTSHPRCANCHTGESDRPMWSGPSYGKTRPHGMNIRAGESRIGAEFISCQTCHTTKDTDWENANTTPHAAPRVAMFWQLAPVEADWFGRSSVEICEQLRDPERNADREHDGGKQDLLPADKRPGATVDGESMKEFVGDFLASYKRPRRTYSVEALPRNALGKVQKHRLSQGSVLD